MDKKRLSHDEYNAFVSLKAVQAVLRSPIVLPVLKERLKGIKFGARDAALTVRTLDRLADALQDTVPDKQSDTLDRNLAQTELYTGVRTTRKFDKTHYGMVLSWNQIDALRTAAREKCVMCTLDAHEQRRCPLAKLLDELPGEKNENARGCGYYGI